METKGWFRMRDVLAMAVAAGFLWVGLSVAAEGQARLSVPPRLLAEPGEEMTVPVYLHDASNVFALRVQFLFPPGPLTYNRVSNGTLLTGWPTMSVNTGSGFVTFANANWTPLSGGGELFRIVFDVAAEATEDTLSFGPLTDLNDGALPVVTANARFGPDYHIHTADQNSDQQVDLSELLRVIQFFNSGRFHCQEDTEDGYAPGPGDTASCSPHAGDYNPQDWSISLSELLRVIQFFNSGGYQWCPEEAPPSEDSFCPGPASGH